MIKLTLAILLCLFLASSGRSRQVPGTITLNIDLSSAAEKPSLIVIKKYGLGAYALTADTSKVTASKFSIKSPLPETEIQDIIFIWSSGLRKSISFRAFPGKYQVLLSKDLKSSIKGSDDKIPAAADFSALEQALADHQSAVRRLVSNVNYENRKIEDVESEINKLKDSMETVLDQQVYRKFLLDHLNSPAGLYALTMYAERPLEKQRRKWKPEEIETLMQQLSPELKQMPSFSILREKLARTRKLAVGNRLEDLSLLDTAGKSIRISDFKGKYLLVEFWASWCVPCRQEGPRLIEYLQKYQSKGFGIVAVTLDKQAEQKSWMKAIKQDGVGIWPQLSDFDELAQRSYDIKVIPSNFLLDGNGTIIAFDLRGDELEKKLKELLAFK
jgi:thiol-disulfide isomerase/thioredoxin